MLRRQSRLTAPMEQDLFKVIVSSGVYKGTWMVDGRFIRIKSIVHPQQTNARGLFSMVQTDEAVVEAGLELAPVSVLIAGIQHDRRFYEMLRGTYNLTGSVVVYTKNNHILGTPVTSGESDKRYYELRDDRPTSPIQPQYGSVSRLDTDTYWGTNKFNGTSEATRHPTSMYNKLGDTLVGLFVGGVLDFVTVSAIWDQSGYFQQDGCIRLAKKVS